MIVLGDISGIQNYVFDVAEEGGGQAQRLRARSFFVQLLAETAALRVLRAVDWPLDSVLISGAGKFVIRGPAAPAVDQSLAREQQTINEWLLRESRAELRLTLASADSNVDEKTAYDEAQRNLQRAKARPWVPAPGASWGAAGLVLAPLDAPCELCRHAPAQEDEPDRETGQVRRVCRTCFANRQLGQRLPRANWLIIREKPQSDNVAVLGLGAAIVVQPPGAVGDDIIAVANLDEPERRPSWCPAQRFLKCRLMAHVPTDRDGQPVWFTELVRHAQGDRLLGVLKADADSLGVRFHQLLQSSGLEGMARLSEQLDKFFAGRLRHELAYHRDGRWQSIYTIFAGGDDLVMVGPWDIMLDFAGHMYEWFKQEFRADALTLSAGLALIKPKRPIKVAVAEAQRLLDEAKTRIAAGESVPKDQFGAFGHVWKWRDHVAIVSQARQLVEWVAREKMERGWLYTLLELAESRDPIAPSRLAYHVARNYRDRDVRRWGEQLSERFDDQTCLEVRYLPVIVRYALTATRSPGEGA